MEMMMDWTTPETLWFLMGILLLLAEFALPGLIAAFFGIGAWIVALTCLLFDVSLSTQLLVFLTSSVALLAVFRSTVVRSLQKGGPQKYIDDTKDGFVGEVAVVKRKVTPDEPGRVEFHGTDWDATSYLTIPEGTEVLILNKDNLTLLVQPLDRS